MAKCYRCGAGKFTEQPCGHCGGLVNADVNDGNYTPWREFQCFFNLLGWHHWSLGIHFDPLGPHLDLHVPFGFFRIGWMLHRIGHARSFSWK